MVMPVLGVRNQHAQESANSAHKLSHTLTQLLYAEQYSLTNFVSHALYR